MDVLALGALAFNAPIAALTVGNPDTGWHTFAYGVGRSFDGLSNDDSDPGPMEQFSLAPLVPHFPAGGQPVELPDLPSLAPHAELLRPPHGLRWAYGAALVDRQRGQIGVVAVMDRLVHTVTRRELDVLGALVRQLPRAINGPALIPVEVRSPVSASVRPAPRPAVEVGQAAGCLIRTAEVAALFNVTDRTVHNWVAAGRIPSMRTVGGHLRFRRDEIVALLETHPELAAG